MGGFFSKDNEKPSLGKKNGADIECGDGETEQMAQVACCMTIKMEMKDDTAGENEMPTIEGDDEIVGDEMIVIGKRMEDMVETHNEAVDMCKAEGSEWGLCLIDDLISGQIYVQETVEEEMTITARKGQYVDMDPNGLRRRLASYGTTESYAVWVHDQCEPLTFTMDADMEYEAVAMTAEFNASNESSTAAIDSDSMLIGAGIGAVAMLLVVGLFAMIMKWRKSAAKQQESEVSKVVDAPNVVHVEDDSAEVAKVEGTATVAV